MNSQTTSQALIDFSVIKLQSLKPFPLHFIQRNIPYHPVIGTHLRHILEHYETLLFCKTSQINYELRNRDVLLESNPFLVIQRVDELTQNLHGLTGSEISKVLMVGDLGGSDGADYFNYASSIGRELCFLNSHCTHHLAMIKPICEQLQIPLDNYFGYAPSTIAFLESQKVEAL